MSLGERKVHYACPHPCPCRVVAASWRGVVRDLLRPGSWAIRGCLCDSCRRPSSTCCESLSSFSLRAGCPSGQQAWAKPHPLPHPPSCPCAPLNTQRSIAWRLTCPWAQRVRSRGKPPPSPYDSPPPLRPRWAPCRKPPCDARPILQPRATRYAFASRRPHRSKHS